VEGDNTVMGLGSSNFAVPGMAKRGRVGAKPLPLLDPSLPVAVENIDIKKMIREFEYSDDAFIMNEGYDGPRDGMVYKDGAQGLGYYNDVTLVELWKQRTSD
jgi:hypothetical protein